MSEFFEEPEQPHPDEKMLIVDGEVLINIIAALVERAGGSIKVSQNEFNALPGVRVTVYGYAAEQEGAVTDYLRVTTTFDGESESVVLRSARP